MKIATEKVQAIQRDLDSIGVSDDLLNQEKLAQIHLEKALDLEEIFWQQKSKVKWHLDGDRNTTYFHRVAKIRNASNLITSMTNGDVTLTNPSDISEHIVNHFKNLFNNDSHIQNNGMVEEVIPSLITDRTNSLLTALPTDEEIHKAVFSLNKESAPGPDGFGALFFQTFWDIIKNDVTKVVFQFFKLVGFYPILILTILCLFLKLTMQMVSLITDL